MDAEETEDEETTNDEDEEETKEHGPRLGLGDLLASSRPIREGYLIKKGGQRHSWRQRWFVLTTQWLLYFENAKCLKEKGRISLLNVISVSKRDKNKNQPPIF